MAAGRIVVPGWMPALDSNGAPIPNAQIYIYLNGTTTLATVYSDDTLTTPIANPVEANSSGRFPEIWADDANLFSISVDAPFGPPGIPFSFDSIGPATVSAVIETATEAGTAAANAVVAGKADKNFGNVSASDYSSKTFPIPLGGGNQAPVPVDLKNRFREFASTEDFGVRLYQSGTSGPLQDNQAALQDAIDKLQARNACLYVPNYGSRYGTTTLLTGPLALRDGTIGSVNYDNCGIAIVGENQGNRDGWQNSRFDLGQGFKLISGATQPLITSPSKAGHLVLENLLLAGGGANTSAIDLVDAPGAGALGGQFRWVFINGFNRQGLRIGANRARGFTENLWIEYCGTPGLYSALFQGSYDWEHIQIGLGQNYGGACYIGTTSQLRFFGGAMWQSEYGCVVSAEAQDAEFFGIHFDNNRNANLDIRGYVGAVGRRGGRNFVGCRTSGAGQAANNTYDNIILTDVRDTVFIAHDFMGGYGGEANMPRYSVNADATSVFRTDSLRVDTGATKPYATAFINDWSRLRLSSTDLAGLGVGNGGSSLTLRAEDAVYGEIRANTAFLGGPAGQHALKAERISGGAYNRAAVQSTSNAFDFVIITADSDGANCDLALNGKGTGVVRFGNYTAGSITPNGFLQIRDDSGQIFRIQGQRI